MRVDLSDLVGVRTELKIIFLRTSFGERRKVKGKELIDTVCKIFVNDEERITTEARQNPLDNYNKIVGRKIALVKALKKLSFTMNPDSTSLSLKLMKRGRRKRIWKVFYETFHRWN